MHVPTYFEAIRKKAAGRWNQLESDPDLAGPWHQLFKQVQSPRHILSELLQNADDAGATEATVKIDNGLFLFSHNGEDFSDEHFASICRFGYSNKRALHTIGFRGIGFKSTFSLGDVVELHTPSLSVAFDRKRFTEPRWIEPRANAKQKTIVCVQIADKYRQREVEKNLEEWLRSPVSLLFFRSIRRLSVGERDVYWCSNGLGPVADTEWMALKEKPNEAYLVVRSAPEEFPSDALDEIRQERMVGPESDIDFPPCRVELVVGASGHLYVVLPTGVETELPFACNAPFIQDPARLKIKDPETSPTNRWLLDRAGKLAAETMLRWLGKADLGMEELSRAYDLFPDVDRDATSLNGNCGSIVEESFVDGISDKAYLLTDSGELEVADQTVILPNELVSVWPAAIVAQLLDGNERRVLSDAIAPENRQKLINHDVVAVVARTHVMHALRTKRLPRPVAWRGLLKLWAYLSPEFASYRYFAGGADIRLLPVQGSNDLYAAKEVVRLGEKKLLQSEDDWEFVAEYLIVLNQNWRRFLAEQRRDAETNDVTVLGAEVESAYSMLGAMGLDDASDASEVIEKLAGQYFMRGTKQLNDFVRIAQIACKLGATVGEKFRFANQLLSLVTPKSVILYDASEALEEFFATSWRAVHFLHSEYHAKFTSCTKDEWLQWVASGRAGLLTFAPLVEVSQPYWNKEALQIELRKREALGPIQYHYKTNDFRVEDWDFEAVHWDHWQAKARTDPGFWAKVLEKILSQANKFWTQSVSARAVQVATTGTRRAICSGGLLPSWILKFRDLPCILDTRGGNHKPQELLRRTPETEVLLDIEPFVHGRLDTEANRPLLQLLGVRDIPTGPFQMLQRLRALAKAEKPPVLEVEKWYHRLDQMLDACTSDDFAEIRKAFSDEKIVLTESGDWTTASGVFLSADDEDVPGMAVVRSSLSYLMLWKRVGVADHATADLAIEWLKSLPEARPLSPMDMARVRALQARHAMRIWHECGHWLSMNGKWVKVTDLSYALTMQSLVPWSHLHERIKNSTADLTRVPAEIAEISPFAALARLSAVIEDHIQNSTFSQKRVAAIPWLNQFGEELSRVELDNEDEENRVRTLARSLAGVQVRIVPALETVPYISGTPAGTAKRADVVWRDDTLFVDDLSKAKLAKAIPDKLGKVFANADFVAALNYCFERTTEEVVEYIAGNFVLGPKAGLHEPVEHLGANALPTNELEPGHKNMTREGDPTEIHVEPPTEVGELPADISQDNQNIVSDRLKNHEEPRDERPRNISPKQPSPSLIERFAKGLGFQKNVDGGFVRKGERIERTKDETFTWKRTTVSNDAAHYYLPLSHCLERAPLQLEADIWSLIEEHPDKYSLVLIDFEANPVEVTGTALRNMRDEGNLTLYPATYRLVLTNVIPD